MKAAPPVPDSPPGKRIEVFDASLRCFVYSLVGLLPLIGLPFSLAAMLQSQKTARAAGADWNPAQRYLRAARRVGPLGFLTSAGFLLVVGVVLPALWGELISCGRGST
jgi:hypothetical protein